MNKPLIIGLVIAVFVTAGGGALALRELSPKVAEIVSIKPITAGMEQEYAEVIGVDEILDPARPQYATVVSALTLTQAGQDQNVCQDVVVTRKVAVKDEKQIAGTATGAIIGAAIGNQVGDGNGRKAATAVGAIIGGVVGKKVQTEKQNNNTYQTTEQRCHVELGKEKIRGYKVTYELDGNTADIFLESRPDKELLVVNGQVVTDQAEVRKVLKAQLPPSYTVSYKYAKEEGRVIMSEAPEMGALLLMKEGRVVTNPKELAMIETHRHDVIAYKVDYKLGRQLGEVRMSEKPIGNTLSVKNGKVVLPEVDSKVEVF